MLVQVVVQQGADSVVRRGHRMEVACKVQIDLLHRQHLGIATTGGTTLHAETGTQRGFAQRHSGLLTQAVQAQRQSDADGGLADTGFRGADGRHQDEAALLHLLFVDKSDGHLRHVASIGFNLFWVDAQLSGNLADGFQLAFACNLYVCLHNGFIFRKLCF